LLTLNQTVKQQSLQIENKKDKEKLNTQFFGELNISQLGPYYINDPTDQNEK